MTKPKKPYDTTPCIRARWKFRYRLKDLPHMFFYVKFNFKPDLFSSIFWFEHFLRSENAFLFNLFNFWPFLAIFCHFWPYLNLQEVDFIISCVKFNSKAALFSSTFSFECSFRSEKAILIIFVCIWPFFTIFGYFWP